MLSVNCNSIANGKDTASNTQHREQKNDTHVFLNVLHCRNCLCRESELVLFLDLFVTSAFEGEAEVSEQDQKNNFLQLVNACLLTSALLALVF